MERLLHSVPHEITFKAFNHPYHNIFFVCRAHTRDDKITRQHFESTVFEIRRAIAPNEPFQDHRCEHTRSEGQQKQNRGSSRFDVG